MKQMYTTTVQVQGKGQTKAAAFSAALSQVQQAVMNSTETVLLRIEPQDLRVISAEEKITREKFLFFFLPREKRQYAVTLDITVNVTAINTGQVTFATH